MISRVNTGDRLGAALVASTSLHVAAIGLLGALAPLAQRPPDINTDRLEVRLVSPRSEPHDAPALMLLSSSKQPLAKPSPANEATAPPSSSPATSEERRVGQQPGGASASSARIGRVDVATPLSLAVIGEALTTRAFDEFPAEVERPVQLLGAINVPYPLSALAANIEGTVYAWILVDPTGSVDEVNIADGPPELAVAVQEAVANARFRPAMNEGVPIRHYITLEFQFHIAPRTEPAQAAR